MIIDHACHAEMLKPKEHMHVSHNPLARQVPCAIASRIMHAPALHSSLQDVNNVVRQYRLTCLLHTVD